MSFYYFFRFEIKDLNDCVNHNIANDCLAGYGCPRWPNDHGVWDTKAVANSRLFLMLLIHLCWWHILMNYWFPKFQKPCLAWSNDLPEFQHSLLPSSQKTVCPWGTCIEFVSSLIFSDLGRLATLEEGKLISAPHFEARGLTFYEHMKENKAQWKQNLGEVNCQVESRLALSPGLVLFHEVGPLWGKWPTQCSHDRPECTLMTCLRAHKTLV